MCGYTFNKPSRKTGKRVVAGLALAGVTALTVGLAACSPSHSAALHADATSSAVKNNSQTVGQLLGVPSNPVGQVAYVHQLMTSSGRAAIENKVGIPPKNRSAFEAAVLGAAEKTNLTSKGNRETFLEVTLPALVKKYQN
jgi:hypothetical protein